MEDNNNNIKIIIIMLFFLYRLFNNRIMNSTAFLTDKRFEIGINIRS